MKSHTKELDFSLATTEEIIKELAQRAKRKRKKNIDYYGNQKSFAKHIGISYRSYQQFEISGKITLERFIDVLRGLDALEEVQGLLKPNDEDLFDNEICRKETKPHNLFKNEIRTKEVDKDDDDTVDIPDVFNQR